MGMYTELVLKVSIKDNVSDSVTAVLNYMFNDAPKPIELPKDKFFTLPRWDSVGRCSSYYHVPWSVSKFEAGYIFSRSDLKNYDDEIDEFIKWLSPYIDTGDTVCIGWKWYEEDDSPTLLYKQLT